MGLPVADHLICEHCGQPRSAHTKKFGRCPSYAAKRPSTFKAAKEQPSEVKMTPSAVPAGPAQPAADAGALDAIGDELETIEEQIERTDPPTNIPDEDDRENHDDDEGVF